MGSASVNLLMPIIRIRLLTAIFTFILLVIIPLALYHQGGSIKIIYEEYRLYVLLLTLGLSVLQARGYPGKNVATPASTISKDEVVSIVVKTKRRRRVSEQEEGDDAVIRQNKHPRVTAEELEEARSKLAAKMKKLWEMVAMLEEAGWKSGKEAEGEVEGVTMQIGLKVVMMRVKEIVPISFEKARITLLDNMPETISESLRGGAMDLSDAQVESLKEKLNRMIEDGEDCDKEGTMIWKVSLLDKGRRISPSKGGSLVSVSGVALLQDMSIAKSRIDFLNIQIEPVQEKQCSISFIMKYDKSVPCEGDNENKMTSAFSRITKVFTRHIPMESHLKSSISRLEMVRNMSARLEAQSFKKDMVPLVDMSGSMNQSSSLLKKILYESTGSVFRFHQRAQSHFSSSQQQQ